MKRSRLENRELHYNIRINGRIWASFRTERVAKDKALSLQREHPNYTVRLSTQDGATVAYTQPDKEVDEA